MKTIIQTLRTCILLVIVIAGANGLFAQTTTNTQQDQLPVSSDKVLTRTQKATQPTDQPERKIITGCTELTRVKPVTNKPSDDVKANDVPVTIERGKKD